MIKVFFGENRVGATEAVKRFLGDNYEVVEGEDLTSLDLPNVFFGGSLFAETRKIMVRDLLANKSIGEEIANYLETPHEIAILETKIDKRSGAYKVLKDRVEFLEFQPPKKINAGKVFDIYNVAKQDGPRAVKMLEEIEQDEDPMMFFGLLVSQAMKDFNFRSGEKEKRALKKLSELDMKLKSSAAEPWLMIKAFLMNQNDSKN